jgi:putative oxidoreductase
MSAAISLSAPRDWRAAIVRTADDRVAFALRTVLALVMFPHGAQHLLGWFGGFGYAGTHGWMTGTLGIPAPFATLAIVVEFVAPIALLLGAFGRLAALGLGAILAVAATTHVANGFFMNWIGKNAGEGFEYHVLAIAIAAAIVVRGSGSYSIDRRL